MLTDQQIADLEALLVRATRPPWQVNHTRSSRGLFIEDASAASSPLAAGRWICGEINNNGEDRANLANADLIVAAVNALPALIEEVREARQRDQAGLPRRSRAQIRLERAQQQIADLRAENERLRRALNGEDGPR